MCGICGIWYFNGSQFVDQALLNKLTDPLTHRGPDEAGFYCDDGLGLGFRRLRILDLEGSRQPISNETGQIWLVCNGEIYNYPELRGELLSHHQFRTKGDAETILHLYEEHGVHFVEKLRGMFALALWDSRAEQLTLVVDRFGKKPLYYLVDGEKIVFASELKAILQFPGVCLPLNYEALDEYLSCGYIGAPQTIFKGIQKLCPGQLIRMRRGGAIQEETYWQPRFALPNAWDKRPLPDIQAELFDLLADSVRIRLASEVPIGAFLSGGIDSTAVVGLMKHCGASLKTFSAGFEDHRYDETDYAEKAAHYYRSEHHTEIVHTDALELLPVLVRHYDEPFADSSMIPTYLVARLASKYISVVLSGDGGDEVFAGYHQHLYARRQQFLRSIIPASLFPLSLQVANLFHAGLKIKPYLTDKPAQAWLSNGFFSARERGLLYRNDTRHRLAGYDSEQAKQDLFQRVVHLDSVSQLQYHDLARYLPGDILVKVDRASMMNSLEVRSPLLDHKVFEFMARIPVHYRVGMRGGKLLLKQALRPILPPFIHKRSKQGFSLPQAEWLRDRLQPMLDDLVYIPLLFDTAYIRRMVHEHQSSVMDHKDRLWALLCLELWLREHQDHLQL